MASPAAIGPRVDRYPTDAHDPDRGTALTLEVMCRQIKRSALNPALRSAGMDAVRRFRGGPLFASTGRNPFQSLPAIVESVYWWARHVLRFQHHEGLIRVWFQEQDQLQLLISPDLLLKMDRPRGDCAIYTALICAMLRTFGIEYEIVTLAVDPSQPDVFSHVYPRAVVNGARLVLDASHGKYVGWEVPREHQIRRQVWDSDGNPIRDLDRGRFRGLHGYSARPRGPILPQRLTLLPGGMAGYPTVDWRGLGWERKVLPGSPYSWAWRKNDWFASGMTGLGLGRGQSLSDAYVGGMGQIDLGYTVPNPAYTGPVYTPPDTTAVAVPAPSAVSPLANLFGNLAQQWTQIGSRVIAPTTTISSGPAGTQIVTPAGSALPGSALLTPTLAGASGIGGWLVLVFGGIVVIIFVSSLAKSRK